MSWVPEARDSVSSPAPSQDNPTLPLHRAIAQLHQLGEAWGGVVGSGRLLQVTGVAPGLGA